MAADLVDVVFLADDLPVVFLVPAVRAVRFAVDVLAARLRGLADFVALDDDFCGVEV